MFYSSAITPAAAGARPASHQPDLPWGWELAATQDFLLGKSCHKVLPIASRNANGI